MSAWIVKREDGEMFVAHYAADVVPVAAGRATTQAFDLESGQSVPAAVYPGERIYELDGPLTADQAARIDGLTDYRAEDITRGYMSADEGEADDIAAWSYERIRPL